MKTPLPRIAGIALLYAASFSPALATPVTIGHLSSNDDGSTQVIKDTLNNREWLRWDILKNLTYKETLAAILSGGSHYGWKIAKNQDAQLFVDALLGTTNLCTNSGGPTTCWETNPITSFLGFGALVGDDYEINSITKTYDIAHFLSDNDTGEEVGWLSLFESISSSSSSSKVIKHNEGYSISESDQYSSSGSSSSKPISWLLYRSATSSIPESSTLLLLSIGFLGLGFSRKKLQ